MSSRIRTISELLSIPNFEERFEYLKIGGRIGVATFGGDRYLNQMFYTSPEWRKFRNYIIARDNGCDMAMEGYEIGDQIVIHHMNAITREDVINRNPDILDERFVVCVSERTHRAIHYGDKSKIPHLIKPRRKGDTCLWR